MPPRPRRLTRPRATAASHEATPPTQAAADLRRNSSRRSETCLASRHIPRLSRRSARPPTTDRLVTIISMCPSSWTTSGLRTEPVKVAEVEIG